MLEGQRRSLLESMGLKILRPRFRLPAAKPSTVLITERFSAEAVPLAAVLAPVVADAAVVAKVDMGNVATEVVRPSIVFDQKSSYDTVKAPTEAPRVAVKAIRFRHRLVRVGELLMLLDQPTLEWHDNDRCKTFFADLYFSLTGKKFEYWSDAQFDWPPVKNFPYANDESIAQQTLQAFIDEQVQQPPCKWVMLWGQGVTQSLLGKSLAAGEMEFIGRLPVLVVENYQDYWREPVRKQILWQQLQVVKKSLAGNA